LILIFIRHSFSYFLKHHRLLISATNLLISLSLKPDSVVYLIEKGIRCLRCGEPIWGSLESAAKEKGFKDKEISKFVAEINNL
jgi:hypothetical protein